MLEKNTFKENLLKNKLCTSAMVPFYCPGLVEMLGSCNIDAICFDSEHGSLDISQIEDLSRSCELVGVTPICRVSALRQDLILRTMDAGVMGIVCPHIKTVEEAENLVSYIKYPPQGCRGMAMTTRASGYSRMTVDEYTLKSNQETMAIIQIEDIEGVNNFESIIKVNGLDAIFIGRNDLALSMGYKGNLKAPEVQKAIDKIVDITLGNGLPLMIATDEIEGVSWVKRGTRIVSIHIVPLLRRKLNEVTSILLSSV